MPRRRVAPPVDSTPAPAPPMGHNRPAPLTDEELQELLGADYADLVARRDELLAGAQRFNQANPVILTDEICGKAADFAGGKGAIAAFLTRTDKAHTEAKAPFLLGGRVVDAWFKRLDASIAGPRQSIRDKVTAYLQEKERLAAEDARAKAEAAAAAAAAAEQQAMRSMKPGAIDRAAHLAAQAEAAEERAATRQNVQVEGSYGTATSLKGRWTFVESESSLMELARAVVEGKAPISYLAFNTTRIGYAVRSEKVRAIPGCVIREEISST